MISSRREFVLGSAALGIGAAVSAAAENAVTPEMFGAKGDGRTNDAEAFAKMSAHVNARGGGTILLRPVTYIVGQQHPSAGGERRSFVPLPVIELSNCRGPISIRGNGARLRTAPGLRYGRFDPRSGQSLPDAGRLDRTNLAVPYKAMIDVSDCSGSIEISDIELDGGLQRMRIGGKSARNGWDAGGFGIRLFGNSGPERVSRVNSHHHPADGILLTPARGRTASTVVSDAVFEFNGRQGCSITGGRNFSFQRCKFNHTGKAGLHHPPGHGVDIEPEGEAIGNVAFADCEFSDNSGMGIGEAYRDVADIRFARCKFVGTSQWAAWIPAAASRFTGCTFVGTIIHTHGDPDRERATQFHGCTFTDDPALSPNGRVYLGYASEPGSTSKVPKTIAAIDDSQNVLFGRCHFRLVRDGLLPRTGRSVIYADCDMMQRAPQPSTPRGTYTGTNVIRGNANLDGSIIQGSVTLNGRALRRSG